MKKSSIICCLALVSIYAFLFIYACGGNGDGSVTGISDVSSSGGGTSEFATDTGAKLLIEHNATEERTGFQGFTGGQLWYELTISGPNGQRVITVTPEGGLGSLGLTELFFKTSETKSTEVPVTDVLASLPEGYYTFEFWNWDYDPYSAMLTHTIPAGPVLITPVDGSTVDPDNLIVSWEPVREDINGSAITIVGYQVNVERDEAPEFSQGFAQSIFSIHVPATVTSMTIPREFLENNACYKYKVLAIEESGNQTVSSAEFDTGPGCVGSVEQEPDTPLLTEAKLLIEHNATEERTGFQGFTDGSPWNQLTIRGPDGQLIFTVTPEGGLRNFGLTKLFFNSLEILSVEVPIADVLSSLPEGVYMLTGDMVNGDPSELSTTLTHKIPAGPILITPSDGSIIDQSNLIVSWGQVNEDINGAAVTIVGYQVKLVKNEVSQFPQSFARSLLSVHLPATVTSVTVPKEFIEGGAIYKYQVLAIEESGNQTISSAMFGTQ